MGRNSGRGGPDRLPGVRRPSGRLARCVSQAPDGPSPRGEHAGARLVRLLSGGIRPAHRIGLRVFRGPLHSRRRDLRLPVRHRYYARPPSRSEYPRFPLGKEGGPLVNDREFVAALRACGAIQFGTFTLASGKTSDYYVDIKQATRPDLLREIGTRILPWVRGYERIAAVEL